MPQSPFDHESTSSANITPLDRIYPGYIGAGYLNASMADYLPDHTIQGNVIKRSNVGIPIFSPIDSTFDNDSHVSDSSPEVTDFSMPSSIDPGIAMDNRAVVVDRPSLSVGPDSPAVLKVASTQLPHIKRSLTVEVLNHLIHNELMGAAYKDSKTLVDKVFPDRKLPIAIDDKLIHGLEHGNQIKVMKNGGWYKFPSLMQGTGEEDAVVERNMAGWLNNLLYAVQTVGKHTPMLRQWTARHANSVIPSTMYARKPDNLLIPVTTVRHQDVKVGWEQACGLLEITSSKKANYKPIINTLCNKVFICFTAQPHRRFFPALYFHNESFRFLVFDRSGGVQSELYNINKDHRILLRILVGFSFADEETIGFDPSIKHNLTFAIESVILANKEYEIIKQLIATQSLRGRATHVWVVKCPNGRRCIMKDCWIGSRRSQNEIDVLKLVKGVRGFPTILDGEVVHIGGKIDSTAWLRSEFPNFDDLRYHLRIAMEPVGIPLSHFETRKELIGIFIDVLNAHRHLCTELGFLHRDISYSNIMAAASMAKNAVDFNDRRKVGMLIDFGYATKINDKGDVDDGDRTGTAPFMAIAVLSMKFPIDGFRQKPIHDIESIFYVFLYVCMKLSGPRQWTHDTNPVDQWFDPRATFSDLAMTKIAHMGALADILRLLPSYFSNFYPLFGDLWDVMFSNSFGGFNGVSPGNKVLHDPIIKVFEDFYATLPDTEPSPETPKKKGKRRAEEADIALLPNAKQISLTWEGPTSVEAKTLPGHPHSVVVPGEKAMGRSKQKKIVARTDRKLRSSRRY